MRVGEELGVLYNEFGSRILPPDRLDQSRVTLAVLTRNREEYVLHLIDTIEKTFSSPRANRVLHVNNTQDNTVERVREHFPAWGVIEYRNEDFAIESDGLRWIKEFEPQILCDPAEEYSARNGYVPPNSIAWLRNQMVWNCQTPWLISFDDDCEVNEDWFEYYKTIQSGTLAGAIINNWAFTCIHRSVYRTVGMYDERFVSNHGYEDTDFSLRMNRAGVRWVLGFNSNHDWRSAEEGNPRGSMTGNDRFVHRNAITHGAFSGRISQAKGEFSNANPLLNAHWFKRKWVQTKDPINAYLDRPPFKGFYYRCLLHEEPDWLPGADLETRNPANSPAQNPGNAVVEVKPTVSPISIVLTNRNTLPFLKLALKSIRTNFTRLDHEIVLFDDASDPGEIEWLRAHQEEFRYELVINTGKDRVGIVHAYDIAVDLCRHDVIFIVHSDMYFAKGADSELYRHLLPGTIGCSTRVEPPIHSGQERAKHFADFGTSAESFREAEFCDFADHAIAQSLGKTTSGLFAPFMCFRDDYRRVGGHDEAFAPQSLEDSDLFNRMLLAGYRTVQSWSSLCYHFTSRGSRFKDGVGKNSEEWIRSNRRNRRNFARKWGRRLPSVDEYCQPFVETKYRIGLALDVSRIKAGKVVYQILEELEPYFSQIELVAPQSRVGVERAVAEYVASESQESALFSQDKIRCVTELELADCDVVVRATLSALLEDDFRLALSLPEWLDDQREKGEFTIGDFVVEIRDLRRDGQMENLSIQEPESFRPRLPEWASIERVPWRGN